MYRLICMGFLAASALAEAGMSRAEMPCSGTTCVMNELPACWGNTKQSTGTGALSGQINMTLTSGNVICLEDGKISVSVFYGDEGLGDEGTYRLLENEMEFANEHGAEGWGSFFSEPRVTCEISLTPTKQLLMKSCSDGRKHEPYDIGKN